MARGVRGSGAKNNSRIFKSDKIDIIKAEITSNKETTKSVTIADCNYFDYCEHLFRDTVEVRVAFTDTGDRVDGKGIIEGLSLVGTEDFSFEIQDATENKLKMDLIVNKITPIGHNSKKQEIVFNMTSEEFIRNEQFSSAVSKRYDGKIDLHIKDILKNNLKAKFKEENILPTANNYNFIGNRRRALYILNWLSNKSVPLNDGKIGESAGFILYQTSDGYHYKSIDFLFSQEPKRKYAYTDLPTNETEEFDGVIAKFSSDIEITANKTLRSGAYNTKLIVFDPFNCFYQEIEQNADDTKKGTTVAGKDLPTFNEKFKTETTRRTYVLKDTGCLPSGNVKQQVEKNDEETFEVEKILNQSIRRYNQFKCSSVEITIPADFDLHIGEVIDIQIKSLKKGNQSKIDKNQSGKYLILRLTHRISRGEAKTTMELIRDSVGRKVEGTGMMN
tara:strand:+ start:6122 stop:7459 length:1338 start_codon:yes stop_codon:yes gene_type:complete